MAISGCASSATWRPTRARCWRSTADPAWGLVGGWRWTSMKNDAAAAPASTTVLLADDHSLLGVGITTLLHAAGRPDPLDPEHVLVQRPGAQRAHMVRDGPSQRRQRYVLPGLALAGQHQSALGPDRRHHLGHQPALAATG